MQRIIYWVLGLAFLSISLLDTVNAQECVAPYSNCYTGCGCEPFMPAFPPNINQRFFLTAEALLWKVNQAGLEWIRENDGTYRTPDFKYDWGFRLGLDYLLCHDNWDIDLIWTHFSSTGKDNASGLINDTSSPTPITTTSASNRFRVKLDMIDLDLGKKYYVTRCFTLRPHIGLRNAWIKETEREYFTTTETPFFDNLDFKNDFWGIGLRSGLGTNWRLCGGWSLYSDAAFSVLEGRYDLSVSETGVAPFRAKDKYDVSKAIADLQAGIRWEASFCNCYKLGLQAGWEQHFFWNMYQWQNAGLAPTPNGDLSLSGFVFSAQVGF